MRLSEPRLTAQERNADRPPLHSAQQFQAKALVHLCEIHLWKIYRQQ